MAQAIEYFGGFVLTVFAVFWIISYLERREWNNGVCRKTGKKWVQVNHEILKNKRHKFTYSDGCGNFIIREYADTLVNR